MAAPDPTDYWGPYDEDKPDEDWYNHLGQHQNLWFSYYRHKDFPTIKYFKMDYNKVYWDRDRDNLTIGNGGVNVIFMLGVKGLKRVDQLVKLNPLPVLHQNGRHFIEQKQ